jgi:hypothetical protein
VELITTLLEVVASGVDHLRIECGDRLASGAARARSRADASHVSDGAARRGS